MLDAFSDLAPEFKIGGAFADAREIGKRSDGCFRFLVDLTIEAETLSRALHLAIDLNELLQDRVAYLTFAAATSRLVSVTVANAIYGKPFEIALPFPGTWRSRVPVTSQDLEALEMECPSEVDIALRLFRRGVGSDLGSDAFQHLWAGIESLAAADAKHARHYVQVKCAACGTETSSGRPASHQHIRKLFEHGIKLDGIPHSPRQLADGAREARGRLAHGGRLHTVEFLREISKDATTLQSVLASALSARLPVQPLVGTCPRSGIPWVLATLSVDGPESQEFPAMPLSVECNVAFAMMPTSNHQGQPIEFSMGAAFPIPIDPLALPEFGLPGPAASQ